MGEKKGGFLVKKLIAIVLSLGLGIGLAVLGYGIWIIVMPGEFFITMLVWMALAAAIFVCSIYRFIAPYIQRIGTGEKGQQEVS